MGGASCEAFDRLLVRGDVFDMGLFDVILGRSELPEPKVERQFAISTAAITMEAKMGLKAAGTAGVCIKPVESSAYQRVAAEIEDLLRIGAKQSGTEWEVRKDEYGYLWVVLRDPEFEDIVATVQMTAQILTEQGFGPQLLCAVYPFSGDFRAYWIFNFKQGNYYPFVPRGKERDVQMELRLRAALEAELPIEKDLSRWYPLWGMPV